MPRPPKSPAVPSFFGNLPPGIATWAESLGEALGRGVARGINAGMASLTVAAPVPGRRGRPPKLPIGPVPADRRCKMDGCPRPARSKGLCSAHYQAERRKASAKRG
jgi:hypothetical protein